jgi:Uma2 family endonuclease
MDARSAAGPAGSLPDRKRFTVAEVFAMQEAGVFDAGDFELIQGDLLVVAAKKNAHEQAKNGLAEALIRAAPASARVAIESSLFLTERDAPKPDLMVYPRTLAPEDVRGGDVLLLVEIAEESLAKDLGVKAALYAAHGVQEYWVIEAQSRRTHVHQGPLAEGAWRSIRIVEGAEPIAPAAFPELRLTLSRV